MPKITLGTMAISAPTESSGNDRGISFTPDANCTDFIIGISGTKPQGSGFPATVWWGSHAVANQLATAISGANAHLANQEYVVMYRLKNPTPGALELWSNLPTSGSIVAFVVWQIKGGLYQVRDTGSATAALNDLINVTLDPTQLADWCFYIGQSSAGAPIWSNLSTGGAQTSEVINTRGAHEPGSAGTSWATFGTVGEDRRHVACGAAYQPGISRGQVIIVQ